MMPIYKLRCNECGALWEQICHLNGDYRNLECPSCGDDDVKKEPKPPQKEAVLPPRRG